MKTKNSISNLQKRNHRIFQSGAVFVELSFVLFFFYIPILFTLIEAGNLVYSYKTLVQQVNRTGRYLSTSLPLENREKGACLFRTGRIETDCSEVEPIIFQMGTYKFNITDLRVECCNLVEVKVSEYKHKLIFLNFFYNLEIEFSPIIATYRRVN